MAICQNSEVYKQATYEKVTDDTIPTAPPVENGIVVRVRRFGEHRTLHLYLPGTISSSGLRSLYDDFFRLLL